MTLLIKLIIIIIIIFAFVVVLSVLRVRHKIEYLDKEKTRAVQFHFNVQLDLRFPLSARSLQSHR